MESKKGDWLKCEEEGKIQNSLDKFMNNKFEQGYKFESGKK